MHAIIRFMFGVIFLLACFLKPVFAAHYRVSIIGAGLSGLSAAHELGETYGIDATIFEARNRPGGCVYTDRLSQNNAPFEHGGCFINLDQTNIIELAKKMGCTLTRVINDKAAFYHQFIDNELSTSDNNFARFWQTLTRIAPDVVAYFFNNKTQMNKLKKVSIADYLTSKDAPLELVKLINLTIQNEYGTDIENMWAYELFEVISLGLNKEHFMINGQLGDEAYIITEGGQALISELEKSLVNPVNYHHELTSIKRENNYYILSFKTPNGIINIESDYVIITVPPEVLRESISFELKDIPSFLQDFISRRQSGHNIKTFLYFDTPCWNKLEIGNRFNLLTEHFWIWDNSDEAQGRNLFGLTAFAGGSNASRASELSDQEIENEILNDLSTLIPDIRAHHATTIRGHDWLKDPYSRGSYAGITKPGLYPIKEAYAHPYFNNLFFAGSAWDKNSTGFMEGAVISGKAAAKRVFDCTKL